MKKYTALFFIFVLCAVIFPPQIFATDNGKIAAELELAVTIPENGIQLSKGGVTLKLGDIGETVRHIYIEWAAAPEKWELVMTDASGGELKYQCGEFGFLNEYVKIDDNVTSFEIRLSKGTSTLLSLRAFGEGEPPASVQQWQPPHSTADLLVIAPHAGDEFLYYGGAIPYYTGKGKRVQVAYMTTWLDTRPELMRERLNALYVSGVRNYPVIADFTEQPVAELSDALAVYDENTFFEAYIGLIRRFKPNVIVSSGNYGDGLQQLCFESLTTSVMLSGDAQEYTEIAEKYGAFEPKRLYLHRYTDENTVTMDWGDALDTARKSFAEYKSRSRRAIETEGVYDCRVFGSYSIKDGMQADAAMSDFFDGIDAPQTEAEETAEESPEKPGGIKAAGAVDIIGSLDGPSMTWVYSASGGIGVMLANVRAFFHNLGSVGTLGIAAALCIVTALVLRMKKD